MQTNLTHNAPIIFFDGYCGLCDQFISGVLAHPRANAFLFSPLQGETFTALVADQPHLLGLDSIVVFDPASRNAYTHSSATIFILHRLGGTRAVLATALMLVPLALRDLGYRCMARLRFRLFGKRSSCRLPSPQERALFLP